MKISYVRAWTYEFDVVFDVDYILFVKKRISIK